MKRLRRDDKVVFASVDNGGNQYWINNMNGETIVDKDADYFVSIKNVSFKNNGLIEGRYLGQGDKNLFHDGVQKVTYDSSKECWVRKDGKPVKTARMVTVKNNGDVIVIVAND